MLITPSDRDKPNPLNMLGVAMHAMRPAARTTLRGRDHPAHLQGGLLWATIFGRCACAEPRPPFSRFCRRASFSNF